MQTLTKRKLFIFSLVMTLTLSLIPYIGIRTGKSERFFGFPAQWLIERKPLIGGVDYSFEIFGFLFNIFFFYFLLIGLQKIKRKLVKKNKK